MGGHERLLSFGAIKAPIRRSDQIVVGAPGELERAATANRRNNKRSAH